MAKGKKLEHGCLVKWRGRLEKARKRGHFTEHEASLAGRWNACAVGEAHKLNATAVKYHWDDPIDNKLHLLGVTFSDLVDICTFEEKVPSRDFKKVETCLNRIEERLEKLYELTE